MAQFPVSLDAVFDDAAKTVTLRGSTPAPPRPDSIPENLWFTPGGGPSFELTFPIKSQSIAVAPAIYMKADDSGNVHKYSVEYRNGAWQLPGVLIE